MPLDKTDKPREQLSRLAIIGGGAAGFFAAIRCGELAQRSGQLTEIRIFEGSNQFLKKVGLSGGGRCNLTHKCFDPDIFCQNYPRGQRELRSPMQKFQAKDTVSWFNSRGIDIIVEKDGRMFPATKRSETIVNCLVENSNRLGIELLLNHQISSVSRLTSGEFSIKMTEMTQKQAQQQPFIADKVLIATGSSPAGYRFAAALGHTIIEPVPSLFSFKIQDGLLSDLSGLSFPNAKLKLEIPASKNFNQQGPLLITHWGLSGPAILKLSAWAAREMAQNRYKAKLTVNWCDLGNQDQVRRLFDRLKVTKGRSQIDNVFPRAIPKRFWLNLLKTSGVPSEQRWADLSKKQALRLANSLVATELKVNGKNRFKEEFVECGGVSLKEIDFKKMESKRCPGLFFAGEILDIDGITGGFNLQNAWTTGWVAGSSLATLV